MGIVARRKAAINPAQSKGWVVCNYVSLPPHHQMYKYLSRTSKLLLDASPRNWCESLIGVTEKITRPFVNQLQLTGFQH
jgi:hypothetical protein